MTGSNTGAGFAWAKSEGYVVRGILGCFCLRGAFLSFGMGFFLVAGGGGGCATFGLVSLTGIMDVSINICFGVELACTGFRKQLSPQ